MMVLAVAGSHSGGKQSFESTVEAKLSIEYIEACYSNKQFDLDPARSLCGYPVGRGEDPDGIEFVHAPTSRCVYGLLVDRETWVIKSWRYLSAPEGCWR